MKAAVKTISLIVLGGSFSFLSILIFPREVSAAFSAAPYFPLHTRNAWTYRVDGASSTTTVLPGTTTINGVATKALQDSDGSVSYFTNDANGVRIHREFDPSQGITITFDPPVKIANATTDIGQLVNSSGTAKTNVGNFGYSASFTVQAFETLTVPLGSFSVLRLQGTLAIKNVGTESLTVYVASNIGIVKQVNVADGATLTSELTAVNLAVDCPTDSLQTAVDNAVSALGLSVAGNCNENILVRNEKQRISIDGAGAGAGTRATINALGSSPAFNVRGKGIAIQNFTITGGSNGVHVNRGSNAVLNNNVIQNTNGNGVVVDELAFAVLTNNTIESNPGTGVFITESSSARIGFNSDADATASGNTIQSNGAGGIIISNGSSARIIGNMIQSNTGDGVFVTRDSLADIANNLIDLHTGNGITVTENSGVNLGEDTGSAIFELPNSSVSNNGGFGFRCNSGSYVDGRTGTLSGSLGTTDDGCLNSLIP